MSPGLQSKELPCEIDLQLAIGPRPRVYRSHSGGRRVVVKGPFRTAAAASVAQKVQRFKAEADLPSIESQVVPLLPDLFPEDAQRMNYDPTQVGYFLVSEDVTPAGELPTRLHEPSKFFPQGLEVVDFIKLEERKYYGSVGPWIWSNAALADQLVEHVLLNWVLGVGGDMAMRNFLVTATMRLYNVDVDTIGNMDFHLGNCQVCKAGTKMGEGFRIHLEKFDLIPLRQALQYIDWDLLPAESRAEAQRRAKLEFTELDLVLQAKPGKSSKHKRRSRSKSPKRK